MISLREYSEKVSSMWAYELNGDDTPDTIASKSGKEFYWRCNYNPKHVYKRQVIKMFNKHGNPIGCVYCEAERPLPFPGETDLFSICPKAKDMWDFELNKGFDVECIHPKTPTKAWFKCEEGHTFQRQICRFVDNQNCPICRELKYVVAKFPYMVKQWDFKKNKDININLTSSNSKREAWWHCKKCGYEWQAQIASRYASKGECPCCETRIVVKQGATDLFSLYPNFKDEYNFKKNKEINSALLSVTSTIPVWWECEQGHEWQVSPKSRFKIVNGNKIITGCPYCKNLKRDKSFAEEFPDLAEMYIAEKNIYSFDDIEHIKSENKYWWHCNRCNNDFESVLSSMIRSRTSKTKGCSYCSGKKVKRENSFAISHPEVMDEYDPDNEIDPFKVGKKSNKKAKWICRNNSSHKWETSFLARSNGFGKCPVCKERLYKKMLYQERPDLKKYFDIYKNKRSFNSYAYKSNEKIWWLCEKGHSFDRVIYDAVRANSFECPLCTNKVLLSGENDLVSQYPELAKEFDKDRNSITPDKVINNSITEYWWNCKNGHEFLRSPYYRTKEFSGCPICERTIVVKGVNDFKSTYPKIVDVWDFELNTIGPDEISDRNIRKYFFKCSKGHHYEAYIRTVISNDFECLVCNNVLIQPGTNDLASTHPDLAKQFSPNEDRKPEEFTKDMAYSILWRCPDCSGDYKYPIKDRELNDDSCPYCNRNRPLLGFNSLVDTHPMLAKEWSPANERKAETFTKDVDVYVKWICSTCKGEYSASIAERELGDDSCPYCNRNKPLAGYNSLADTHPELAKEWSPANQRNASTYVKETKKYVKWICPTCKGEYPAKICEREIGDNSCPYCSNKKVLPGFNSFKVKNPDLMEEWDYVSNYLLCNPDFILGNSTEKVWWICGKQQHHFYMSPSQRIYYLNRNWEACIYCKGLRYKKKYYM